ncbi:unnamed protein product [Caenorhabditis brenneri]
MSLSRPAKFPLLKLPWLCIEGVFRSWDIFDILFFAAISKKTRRIVKSFKIPLNRIGISVTDTTKIWLCGFSKTWNFSKPSLKSSFDHNSRKTSLMLQDILLPLYISRTNDDITSYIYGNTIDALKLAMKFLNEMFKCSVERVNIDAVNFPESGEVGVRSTRNLYITHHKTQSLGSAQNQKMSSLLKNLEVTDICSFWATNTELDFYCDPKLFKCKELQFVSSVAWVTLEILLQFEVPRLTLINCLFSVEDILSFVTNWFHSDNKKLEYLYIPYQRQKFSSENFQTAELSPVPFSERNCVPVSESFGGEVDFSKGLEIVRYDGLRATIHVGEERFVFYIWHNQ